MCYLELYIKDLFCALFYIVSNFSTSALLYSYNIEKRFILERSFPFFSVTLTKTRLFFESTGSHQIKKR